MAMSRHTTLPERERVAVQTVLVQLYEKLGSDQAIADVVGASQQSINKARLHGVVGPLVSSGLYSYLETSREAFLDKYAAPENALMLDPRNPEHYAAIVRALGKSMRLPHESVEAFIATARRGGAVPIERVAGALEGFVTTQKAVRAAGNDSDEFEARTAQKAIRRR